MYLKNSTREFIMTHIRTAIAAYVDTIACFTLHSVQSSHMVPFYSAV